MIMARFHATPNGPVPFTEAEEQEADAREAEAVLRISQLTAIEYQRLRAAEYPSLQDQMDMLYWDRMNGTNAWQDAIAAVKAKHPKP